MSKRIARKDVNQLKRSQERLNRTIDGFMKNRTIYYEQKLIANNDKYKKLIAWARKVAEEIDVPLENL